MRNISTIMILSLMRKLTKFTENIKMKKIVLALSILTILLYSCKDEDAINTPNLASTQATQDHLFAEQVFNDVGYIVETAFSENITKKSYPTYTIIDGDSLNIDILIINFGPNNILFPNNGGKLRKGKINITYTGRYRDSLTVITTTFDNYYVDNNLIQGERVVTNKGKNLSSNMWFTIAINNASINTSNGIINWESDRKREWVSGRSTYEIYDDNYIITGSASGTGVNSNSFIMEITDTLNVDLSCLPYCVIKSGTAKISPNGYADRIINYGDSLCDCNFDVSVNGTSYLIVVN